MKSKGQARAGRTDWQQAPLRQGQDGSRLLVRSVAAAAQRDDHIVAVIAAEKKHTDQSFVILGTLGQGVHQSEPVKTGGGESGGSGAASPFQKIPS